MFFTKWFKLFTICRNLYIWYLMLCSVTTIATLTSTNITTPTNTPPTGGNKIHKTTKPIEIPSSSSFINSSNRRHHQNHNHHNHNHQYYHHHAPKPNDEQIQLLQLEQQRRNRLVKLTTPIDVNNQTIITATTTQYPAIKILNSKSKLDYHLNLFNSTISSSHPVPKGNSLSASSQQAPVTNNNNYQNLNRTHMINNNSQQHQQNRRYDKRNQFSSEQEVTNSSSVNIAAKISTQLPSFQNTTMLGNTNRYIHHPNHHNKNNNINQQLQYHHKQYHKHYQQQQQPQPQPQKSQQRQPYFTKSIETKYNQTSYQANQKINQSINKHLRHYHHQQNQHRHNHQQYHQQNQQTVTIKPIGSILTTITPQPPSTTTTTTRQPNLFFRNANTKITNNEKGINPEMDIPKMVKSSSSQQHKLFQSLPVTTTSTTSSSSTKVVTSLSTTISPQVSTKTMETKLSLPLPSLISPSSYSSSRNMNKNFFLKSKEMCKTDVVSNRNVGNQEDSIKTTHQQLPPSSPKYEEFSFNFDDTNDDINSQRNYDDGNNVVGDDEANNNDHDVDEDYDDDDGDDGGDGNDDADDDDEVLEYRNNEDDLTLDKRVNMNGGNVGNRGNSNYGKINQIINKKTNYYNRKSENDKLEFYEKSIEELTKLYMADSYDEDMDLDEWDKENVMADQADSPASSESSSLSSTSSFTEEKWRNYGTAEAVEKSRNRLRDRKAMEALAVHSHSARVHSEWRCKIPKAKVIPIVRTPSQTFTPHCTVLHQCGDDTGCCRAEAQTCVPKHTDVVDLYFFVSTLSIREPSVEILSFINHTECHCVDRIEHNQQNNINGNGGGGGGGVFSVGGTSNIRGGRIIRRSTILSPPSTPSTSVAVTPVTTSTYVIDNRSGGGNKLSTGSIFLSRRNESTNIKQRNMNKNHNNDNNYCICNKDFIVFIETTEEREGGDTGGDGSVWNVALNNTISKQKCRCDCNEENIICQLLQIGRIGFSLEDRRCVSDERCTPPTCKHGQYNRQTGRCPTE